MPCCRFSTERLAEVFNDSVKHGYDVSALQYNKWKVSQQGSLSSGSAAMLSPGHTLADTKKQQEQDFNALPITCGF